MLSSKSDNKVFVLDTRFDQFDLWNKENPVGYDFIILIEANKADEHLKMLNCTHLTSVGENFTKIKEVQINHFLYYYCANFLGLKN